MAHRTRLLTLSIYFATYVLSSHLKKVLSIVLVILILFNTMGFYGLFLGLRYKAKRDIVQRLDNEQYGHHETITIKVPLSIPYNNSDDEYERVNGEIEHEGEFYRLVKQKLAQDTLYIVCIKDPTSKNIKAALAEYVKTFTDKPVQSKSQGKTTISFIKDFLLSSFSFANGSEGWHRSVADNFSPLSFFESEAISFTGPPPKA